MTVWKRNTESRYHVVVSGSPPINFIFKTKVNITCSVNISIHSNTYTSFVASILQAMQYCNNSKHNLNLTVNSSQFILCTNTTPIINRTSWEDYIWVSVKQSLKSATPQIVRIPKTCTNTSVAAPQRVIHFNISFPTLPKCNRKLRAWYDTLLSGLSSRLSVANSIDLEALAHRLKNTRSDISKAVTLNASYPPLLFPISKC